MQKGFARPSSMGIPLLQRCARAWQARKVPPRTQAVGEPPLAEDACRRKTAGRIAREAPRPASPWTDSQWTAYQPG